MIVLYMLLGFLSGFAAVACWIVLLIPAFKSEPWKGVVGLVFPPYLVYYGLKEYKAPNRVPLSIGLLVTIILSALFFELAQTVAQSWIHM